MHRTYHSDYNVWPLQASMNSKNSSLVPVVSFCTAVMDRLHHLRKTLPQNIIANQNCCTNEFVILDYSSRDGLENWVRDEMCHQIEAGLVVFAQLRGRMEFQRSHAKNAAHRLARGEIVCNLDADNFSGDEFSEFLVKEFSLNKAVYVYGKGKGLGGRLAFRRTDFFALGGYDERMTQGWGHEDADLARRAKALGLQPILCSKCGEAISHNDFERAKNCRTKDKGVSRRAHMAISRENLRKGELVANQDTKLGSGNVLVNFNNMISL
jgi:hypothetical protein